MQQYQHSGAAPIGGLAMTLAAGLGSAVVLAFIYAWAIAFIPFIYVNFILTCCLGGGVGFAVGFAGNLGKIRNTMIVTMTGIFSGVSALYLAWAFEPMARMSSLGLVEEAGVTMVEWNPLHLINYISFYYENGFWGIARSDTNVTGFMLAVIWLIEAVMVVGICSFLAGATAGEGVFCERCNEWVPHHPGVQTLGIGNLSDPNLPHVLSGDIAPLAKWERAVAGDRVYLRLDVWQCPSCTDSNYVSLESVQHTVDKDGNEQVNTETLLRQLQITPDQVEQVCQAGVEPRPIGPPDESAAADSSPTNNLPAFGEMEGGGDEPKADDINFS